MPYNRPGFMYYATALANHNHNDPVVYDGVAGVAVKQKAPAAGAAAGLSQKQIVTGEQFSIITKGVVQVGNTTTGRVGDTALSAVKGSPVYITPAYALTLTSSTNAKFGRVIEIAGGIRKVPVGMMRVDLDKKDSF